MKIGMPKISNILFFILVSIYCLTANEEIGGNLSIIKYVVLVICTLDAFFRANKRVKEYKYKREFRNLFIFVLILILYSVIKSILADRFSFRTIQEILFLISPMLYVFFSINTMEKKDIDKMMKMAFIVSFAFYMVSLGMNFQNLFRALMNSSFSNSSSELESHVYCGFSLAFCMYFSYYNKNNWKYKIFSLLFLVMTFKRLFLLMGVFLFILSFFKLREKNISKKVYACTVLVLILFSGLYYNLMLPKNVDKIESRYNISISKLTSTRSDRLRRLERSTYKTYGFGSSTEYMYKYFDGALEMDVVKIIIELGFLPIIWMMYSYLSIAKKNLYTFSFMNFLLLNLIVSSGLTGSFSWILFFMSIFTITEYPEEVKNGK